VGAARAAPSSPASLTGVGTPATAAAAGVPAPSVALALPLPSPEGFRRRLRRRRRAAGVVVAPVAPPSPSAGRSSRPASFTSPSVAEAASVGDPSRAPCASPVPPEREPLRRRRRERLREVEPEARSAAWGSAPAARAGDGASAEGSSVLLVCALPVEERERPRDRCCWGDFCSPAFSEGSSPEGPPSASADAWDRSWELDWDRPRPRPPRRRRRGRGRGVADSSPALCAGTSSVMPRSFLLREPAAPIRPAGRAASVVDGGLNRRGRHDQIPSEGRWVTRTHVPTSGSGGAVRPHLPGYQRSRALPLLEPPHVDVEHQASGDEVHQQRGPPVGHEG
jgi:hypothetical protein